LTPEQIQRLARAFLADLERECGNVGKAALPWVVKAAGHDVSGEARDDHGRWTASGSATPHHALGDTRKLNSHLRSSLPFPAKVQNRRSGEVTISADGGHNLHEHAQKLVDELGAKRAEGPGLKNWLTLHYDERAIPKPEQKPAETKRDRPAPRPTVFEEADRAGKAIWGNDRTARLKYAHEKLTANRGVGLQADEDRLRTAFAKYSDFDFAWRDFAEGVSPANRRNSTYMESMRSTLRSLFDGFQS
jgi:hypothetical protein